MERPDLSRMGVVLEDHHLEIRGAMQRFARDRLRPGAAARDKSGEVPRELIGDLAALGGMAIKTSAEDGGPGIDNMGYALAVEAIARADASVAVMMVASNLSAAIIAAHANEDQRARFLRPLARGELGAASFALTEPQAGSDAAAIRTRAVRGDDGWVLNGAKQWITGAAQAGIVLVFAKTPDLGAGAVTAFIVEADRPGFSLGRGEDLMGLRASGTAQLFFEDCPVPEANVLGAPGKGYQAAMAGLAPSRVAIAAQSLGIAERAFELGLAYASGRQAFGQSVASFQNSRFVLADCRTALDQAWLLMLRSARLLDQGHDVRGEASMAKLAASEACGMVVDRMLQLHGGSGYSRESEIERLYRDARVMRIFEGTSEVQRDLVAREILGR
jgi:alkylation response protein AidB-like acyl-CoA dehydrogenase